MRLSRLVILTSSSFAVLSCGGGAGGGGGAGHDAFAGTYLGNAESQSGVVGALNVAVDVHGNVSGTANVTYTVTGATNATPIVVSTSMPYVFGDGEPVTTMGVSGNTAANGVFFAKATGFSSTTFALYQDAALTMPVAGNGAYTTGGAVATSDPLGGSIARDGSASISVNGNTPGEGTFNSSLATTMGATLVGGNGQDTWVTLVRNPTVVTGANPFAGDYSGSLVNTTKGKTGILSFTVDGSGNLSGTQLTNFNNVPTIATMSGTITNAGVLTDSVIVNNTQVGTISGTVTLANQVLTASALTNTSGDTLTLNAPLVQ